jgi:putative endonuclease
MPQYNFYTYILTNYTKKVLYTGVTNDLERRLYEHYFGIDQKESFTSKYKCYYLVWFERHQYVNHAIEREKEIKGWLRKKKIELIERENPEWRFLNSDIMEWPPKLTPLCHSERSEEPSSICISDKQGEEDVSLSLNMTICLIS